MSHIPNDDTNPFTSLADLILDNESIAVLATAIENNRVYFWDRFGRFKKADKEEDKKDALDLLANFYDWDTRQEPPVEKSEFKFDWYNPLKLYGWAKEVLPNFDNIRETIDEVQPPQRKSAETNRAKSYLILIAALCEKNKIDIMAPGTVTNLVKMTELTGATIGNDTVRSILKEIPDAINSKTP